MTGRDLIIYIMENGLEDCSVFEDGRYLGFMNVSETASKFNVGPATIETWLQIGWIKGIKVDGRVYIPANAKRPELEPRKDEK